MRFACAGLTALLASAAFRPIFGRSSGIRNRGRSCERENQELIYVYRTGAQWAL